MPGLLRSLGLLAGLVAVTAASAGEVIPVSRPKTDNSVRVGVNRIMFRDLPPSLANALAKPFQRLLESQSGLTGGVEMCTDAGHLAKSLNDGTVQIGVFHSFEFAWYKAQYPDLEPLMVAVPNGKKLQAHLVVRSDCAAKGFGDLAGVDVSLGQGTKEHCRLFLERGLVRDGLSVAVKMVPATTAEDGLLAVARGEATATVVDSLTLASFYAQYSTAKKRLKVLHTESFPLNLIAYRKSHLDEATLARIRNGLQAGQTTPQGQTMMQMWKLNGFATVPADYNEQLAAMMKLYPPPADLKTPK